MSIRRTSLAVACVLTGCASQLHHGVSSPARDPHRPASGAVSAWPAAIHDATHSGTSRVDGPTTGHVRWTRNLGANVTPGPVVGADGTIYAATNSGVLHALDPATGADRWTFDGGGAYGVDLSTSPAVLDDGTILWPGSSSTLFALSPAGRLEWSEPFAGEVLSPAVASDNVVYVMTTDATLTRLDVSKGAHRRRWTIGLGTTSYGSPAIAPDGTVVTSVDNDLVTVLDQGDHGAVKWRYDTGDVVEVSPAIASDGTVVIGTNGRTEIALRPDGTVRWTYPRNSQSYSSAAITPDGVAWFGDHHGYLNGVRVRDGHLVRRVQGMGRRPRGPSSIGVWTSPAIDHDGNVYFGTRPGHIYGFASNGRRLFDINAHATIDSYPAIAGDGTLLIGATNGTLYAIQST